MGSASGHAVIPSETCSRGGLNARTTHKQEIGLRMYEVHHNDKACRIRAEKDHLVRIPRLLVAESIDKGEQPQVDSHADGEFEYDKVCVLGSVVSCGGSWEDEKMPENSEPIDCGARNRNTDVGALQHSPDVKHKLGLGSIHAKRSLGKFELLGCAASGHQLSKTSIHAFSSASGSPPDCWNNMISCGEQGMLRTLQSTAQSLALQWGFTDGWCHSLCQELLDEDCIQSDDDSSTLSTG